jgi:hypothetical protein
MEAASVASAADRREVPRGRIQVVNAQPEMGVGGGDELESLRVASGRSRWTWRT